MYFSFFFAKNYPKIKTFKHLIQRLSFIASLSIALSTMTLLLVLSTFNGMEQLIHTLFRTHCPTIKIDLKQGKYFQRDPLLEQRISSIPGVVSLISVLEDTVLIRYKKKQVIAKLKGVSENFMKNNPLETYVKKGNFQLKQNNTNFAMLSNGIQFALAIHTIYMHPTITILYPKQRMNYSSSPSALYEKKDIKISTLFSSVEKQFDEKYVIVPIAFTENLFNRVDHRTSLEICLSKGMSEIQVQHAVKQSVSDDFQVHNGREQNADLIKAISIERLFVVFIFSFICLISSLNIFFILSMLVLEKKKDIVVLYTLGATDKNIRNIFLWKGLFLYCKGTIWGILAAFLLGNIQQHLGIISLGIQTGIITAYPIKMELSDFIYTTVSTLLFTLLASYWPAQKATQCIFKK